MTQGAGKEIEKAKRKAIAVVGSKFQWDYLSMLEAFTDTFVFEICILEQDVVNYMPTNVYKTYVYKTDPSKIGQLPGLELRLENAEAIFIFDHWSIASFQASRLASEFDIPLFNIFSGIQFDLFKGAKNLEAAKFDICRTTEKFFVCSDLSKKVLLAEGVNREKIDILPYRVDFSLLGIDRTEKFKKYIGIPATSSVVVFEDHLDGESGAANIIKAWRKFLASEHALNDPYLVISGSGQFAKDLKYLSSDLGVAKKIAFIEQDNFEFKYDLYRCADLYIPAFNLERHNVINPHSRLIEAVACNAYPVIKADSFYQDLLPGINFSTNFESTDQIAKGLQEASIRARYSRNSGMSPKDMVKKLYCDEWDGYEVTLGLDDMVKKFLDTKPDFKAAIELISSLIEQTNYSDAMIEIEDNLMKRFLTNFYRSDLLRLKGLCLREISTLAEAEYCFEQSIESNPSNVQAYLELLKVSILCRNFQKASCYAGKAIALEAGCGEAYLGLALASFEAGMIKQSEFYLESAIIRGVSPLEVIPLVNKIVNLTSDPDHNIKFLEKLSNLVGEDEKYLTALGKLHIEHGDLHLGQKYLSKLG